MAGSSYILQPTKAESRVASLDILRGVAVLGILVTTIQSYSMPAAATVNPTAFENLEGVNFYVWLVGHVFGNEKFLAIFSMLFGAGIVLISQKARKERLRSADLQYRRFFWLLIIGLFHAYLLWYADILVAFAICGFFMFIFRSRKKEFLLRLGIIFLLIGSLIQLMFGYTVPMWEADQFEEVRSKIWLPTNTMVSEEIEFYTSSWERQMLRRGPDAFNFQTTIFLLDTFWRVSGLMLLGMFLYKKGVLTAKQSRKYLSKMVVYGLGLGLPLIAIGVMLDFHYDWDFEMSFFYFSQLNYWGSVLVAIGYIGIIALMCKISTRGFIPKRLAQVGQMSLTNYLLQSVICTYFFYGHGLGFFGDLDRSAQGVMVLMLWVFFLGFSAVWLNYFRYGPFEWLWRSLSYGKLQPMLKST